MFNLKSKLKKVFETPKDVNVLIAEIHDSFDRGVGELLNKKKSDSTDKGERLSKLGFTSTKAAEEASKIKSHNIYIDRVSKSSEYFKTFYPNYKFIDERGVEQICKKYGLLVGDVRYFIGNVPDKNISEMEAFSLRDEDKKKITYEMYKDGDMERYGYWDSRDWGGCYIEVMDKSRTHHYKDVPFKICASIKDFDTRNMRIYDSYKLESIPDPIVLQPVRDGYLIITKWGLEGEDKELVNEKMN